jgi:polar amino acid transport system substrate-binding protein
LPWRWDVRYFRVIVVALLLVFSFFVADEAQSGAVYNRVLKSGVVRIGVPYNLTPQGFFKQTGEWVGFELDFADELAKRMNVKLEKVKVSEKTWGSMLLKGGIDAAICRIKHRRSLESEFDFSVPYFFDCSCILALKGVFKHPDDLKGNKIAAVQGSPSERIAMRVLRQAGDDTSEKNVQSLPDRPTCFLAISRDKIAGWLDSGLVLIEYASKSPGRFELIPVSDELEEVAVALPQDDSAWRDLINFSIQDMVADGSYKRIYDKWFGPDSLYAFPLGRAIEVWPE